MAMNPLKTTAVAKGMAAARQVLEQLRPALDWLNIVYDSVGGVKETLTQADLDANPNYSELTKAQLDDGMYVLTAVLRPAITNAYTQLAQLAVRG